MGSPCSPTERCLNLELKKKPAILNSNCSKSADLSIPFLCKIALILCNNTSESKGKYMGDFIDFMEDYNDINLSLKFKQLPVKVQQNQSLIKAMRHYDYTVNVKWVMAHYNAASKYLGGNDKDLEATGGTSWRKYMHPKYQRRIFYPYLWSEDELKNWGTF